jgi:hypothetical protein
MTDPAELRPPQRWSPLLASFVGLALLAGCGSDGSVEAGGSGSEQGLLAEDPSAPRVALFVQPVADDPDPARRAGAAAGFLECELGIADGGWSQDFGPPPSGVDPPSALEAFVGDGLFLVPGSGFVHAGSDDARRLFTYSFDGQVRAAVIVADASEVRLDADSGWVVETFASCDPAEFDPSLDGELGVDVWQDADGRRVPVSVVRSALGAEHCGWESVTFLTVEGVRYVGDPDGVFSADFEIADFDGDAELPADATDTGYSLDGRHIWLAADRSFAFVVEADRVEAWPSPGEPFGCA